MFNIQEEKEKTVRKEVNQAKAKEYLEGTDSCSGRKILAVYYVCQHVS